MSNLSSIPSEIIYIKKQPIAISILVQNIIEPSLKGIPQILEGTFGFVERTIKRFIN